MQEVFPIKYYLVNYCQVSSANNVMLTIARLNHQQPCSWTPRSRNLSAQYYLDYQNLTCSKTQHMTRSTQYPTRLPNPISLLHCTGQLAFNTPYGIVLNVYTTMGWNFNFHTYGLVYMNFIDRTNTNPTTTHIGPPRLKLTNMTHTVQVIMQPTPRE